jgi:hypothetical protein
LKGTIYSSFRIQFYLHTLTTGFLGPRPLP